MTRAAATLAVLLAALAAAAQGAAAVPVYPSSSLGEGIPLKAYATITPAVHLFGDAITAKLAIVADTKLVDTTRLHVSTDFTPYTAVREPSRIQLGIGRFAQVTWTWTLRCLTTECVPKEPPSDQFHVFRFQTIHISYLTRGGKRAYGLDATWPKVEVLSQVSPGVATFLAKTNHLNWQYKLTPVAAPTYRISPSHLAEVALGGAALLFLLALAFLWRWVRMLRPAHGIADASASGTTLERALAVLAWAHARGDETLQRKALERVAGELHAEEPLPDVDELSRTARELAWSARTPEDEEVETFTERAREQSRTPETEEPEQ